MRNKITILFLVLILVVAAILRFYKLTEVPPSISWDEAAVGYNAWTILNWGKDEWGRTLPLVFKSFEDYKHPVHIYLTIPFIAIFGLNEFGIRASSAFFGVLNVLLIYLLAQRIFKNHWISVLSAVVLTISPYNLQFSRFNHELNFVLFFFMLGVYLILTGVEKKNILLTLGFTSLGLDLLTYHSAKIIVPPILVLLIVLYFRDLNRIKKYFVSGVLAFLLFASLLWVEPQLLGISRFNQTSHLEDRKIENIVAKYKAHFSYDYLFVKGDINPRLSSQAVGEFYKTDILFIAIGVLALIVGLFRKKKAYLIVLAWALLAPIPATISNESPHAARAMFMTGSWHLVIALGAGSIVSIFKNIYLRWLIVVAVVCVMIYSFVPYIKNYYKEYGPRYAIEWQYGMREVASYVKENRNNYYAIYMTDIRNQPYIFFLFYLKTPLPVFLKTVKYNETIQRPSNLVASFDRYKFGVWDPIESFPEKGILYIVGPSHYIGLRHKTLLPVKKTINYPNGTEAFFLVSAGELDE